MGEREGEGGERKREIKGRTNVIGDPENITAMKKKPLKTEKVSWNACGSVPVVASLKLACLKCA